LTVACFVFVRRFAALGQKGWVTYSIATGLATPILIALGMGSIIPAGVAFFIAGMVVCAWTVAINRQFLNELI